MYEVTVNTLPCLDLSTDEALDAVGLTTDDLSDDDWTACQGVGNAAQYPGITSVLAPSATGIGSVLTVYEPHLRPGQLSAVSSVDVLHEDL